MGYLHAHLAVLSLVEVLVPLQHVKEIVLRFEDSYYINLHLFGELRFYESLLRLLCLSLALRILGDHRRELPTRWDLVLGRSLRPIVISPRCHLLALSFRMSVRLASCPCVLLDLVL